MASETPDPASPPPPDEWPDGRNGQEDQNGREDRNGREGEPGEVVLGSGRRMDLVLKWFTEGVPTAAIGGLVLRETGRRLARDVPYQDIARATRKRWLRYAEPGCAGLEERLRALYPASVRPRDLLVVPSFGENLTWLAAGARLCAEEVMATASDKVRETFLGGDPRTGQPWEFTLRWEDPKGVEERPAREATPDQAQRAEVVPMKVRIRIGFSAGRTTSLVAEELGHALAANLEAWEAQLRAIVLGENDASPDADRLPCATGGPAAEEDKRLKVRDRIRRLFRVEFDFVFVNLVAGFDPLADNNPIAFLPGLLRDPRLATRCRVTLFNAMPFVEVDRAEKIIDEVPALRRIRDDWRAEGFDILITSASSISDPHSTFRRYDRILQGDNGAQPGPGGGVHSLSELLIREGVRGDVLFQPLTRERPLGLAGLKRRLVDEGQAGLAGLLAYQPMSLLSLDDVAAEVARPPATPGAPTCKVFFILGPCHLCGLDKAEVLDAVLSQEHPIVTHAIIERSTAEAAIERCAAAPNGTRQP